MKLSFKNESVYIRKLAATVRSEEKAHAARAVVINEMLAELGKLCGPADKAKFWAANECRAAFKAVFEAAGLSESAIKNYPRSAQLAFVHGVAFEPRLFQRAAEFETTPATEKAKTKTKTKTTNKPSKTAAEPPAKIGTVASADEGRAYVRHTVSTMIAWCNKNVKALDLPTRQVVADIVKVAQGL